MDEVSISSSGRTEGNCNRRTIIAWAFLFIGQIFAAGYFHYACYNDRVVECSGVDLLKLACAGVAIALTSPEWRKIQLLFQQKPIRQLSVGGAIVGALLMLIEAFSPTCSCG